MCSDFNLPQIWLPVRDVEVFWNLTVPTGSSLSLNSSGILTRLPTSEGLAMCVPLET